jgi:hypothetical protein
MTIRYLSNEGEPKIKKTLEGGLAVKLTNKTGAASVKGQVVMADTTTDNAFKTATADTPMPLGVVYDSGVADGSECWVVCQGIAEVLLKDSTASTRGYWVKMSDDTAGRVDATSASPPGGSVENVEDHLSEVGHCLESKGSGTDVLAKVLLHFN